MKGNPRKSSDEQKKNLRASLIKFGLAEIPVIDIDNTIIAGHDRIRDLKQRSKGATLIDVRVPNRALTEDERKRYNVLSNVDYGIWDDEKLNKYFGQKDLLSWGFHDNEFVDTTVHTDKNLITTQLETYIEGNRKQIVMYYDLERYNFVMERIFDIMKREKVSNATEVLLSLLSYYETNRTKKKANRG
jgi:hypothetical protein